MKRSNDTPPLPSPLGPAIARLARRLQEQGYPKSTRDQYLSICRAFDHHVQRSAIKIGVLVGFFDDGLSEQAHRVSLRCNGSSPFGADRPSA